MLIGLIYKFLPYNIKIKIIQKARLESFKGTNVFCPCCNTGYLTFLPSGIKLRFNASYPGCHSLERHRLMWLYFDKKLNLFNRTLKILHVAPEKVFFNKFNNSSNIQYVSGAKLEEGFSDEYPPGTINIDITKLFFPDNTFDMIYCSHVLEHIPDDKKAMRELFRVLKDDGFAILQVPLDKNRAHTYEDFSIIDPVEREKAFGQKDHVRVYGEGYKDRLKSTGFIVNVDNYITNFSEEERIRYGLMTDGNIYYCTK